MLPSNMLLRVVPSVASEVQMQGKPWKQATEDAILRICRRRGTKVFDFDSLRQELPQIVKETKTTGKTPENSLSKYMQDLRDEGQIEFVDNQGTYQLIDDDLVARCSR